MFKTPFALASLLAITLAFWSPQAVAADQEIKEATVFFNEVLQHTDNPLIANLAKESLSKLQSNPSTATNTTRSTTPVTLSSFNTQQPSHQALATKPATPTVSDGIEIPLLKGSFSRNLVVPALLNRSTNGTFIVDTGATYSVITPKLARELGVNVDSNTQRIPILTANGWIQAPVVKLSHISLGNVEVRNVQAVVQDLGGDPALSGLLGMNFFSDIELTIRRDKLILRLSSAE
jgi:clan AA aspartic protease (TIGR02281 family)